MKKLLTIALLVLAYAQVDATGNLTARLAANFMKKMNPSTFTPKNVTVNAAKGLVTGFVAGGIVASKYSLSPADLRSDLPPRKYQDIETLNLKGMTAGALTGCTSALLAGGIPGVFAYTSLHVILPGFPFGGMLLCDKKFRSDLVHETKKWTIQQIKEYKHNNGLDS